MQHTRQRILEILKLNGQATVDELSDELELTAVTIRHHLEVLRSESLVAPPEARRRKGPGRPQHVYRLAEEASEYFPKNYDFLAGAMLAELENYLSAADMEDLVDRVAERLLALANVPQGNGFDVRLDATVAFLNDLGYLASADIGEDRCYILYVANCPYERVARHHPQPCLIDEQIISRLLGVTPERLEHMAKGDDRCAYHLPVETSAH